MNINPQFNYEVIEYNKDNISFAPIKKGSENDIAYDCKAKLLSSKTGKPIKSVLIKPKSSIAIPLGFSINQPDVIKVPILDNNMKKHNDFVDYINPEYFNSIRNYVDSKITYLANQIRGHSNLNTKVTDFPDIYDYIYDKEEKFSNYIELIPSSEIHSRSGLGFKKSIIAFNGQIDNLFNTELYCKLDNLSDEPQTIYFGDRICQLEMKLVWKPKVKLNKINNLNDIKATRGGFGSTGE